MFSKFAPRSLAAAVLASSPMLAMAQATDPITTALSSVSLAGVGTAVAAAALLIIAIKLTFKGPDVAGRVIKKV